MLNTPKRNVREGDWLWSPRTDFAQNSNLTSFLQWLKLRRSLEFHDYDALWRWSVSEPSAFWAAIWDYFEIISDSPYEAVMSGRDMPGARWFEGSRVNYSEHLLRRELNAGPDEPVFHHFSELRPNGTLDWHSLGCKVRILATQLRAMGVQPGDRVVSYMPNIPETAMAMIASTAIGAVWSSAAPEFGVQTVVDRFGQIEPKVIFAADGYRFGGKDYHRRVEVNRLLEELPSVKHVIWLDYLVPDAAKPTHEDVWRWNEVMDAPGIPRDAFEFTRVPHDHPLWVVFSSGTTGPPKAIVHSHVGMLAEHLKLMHFHVDLGPGDALLFYSSTGWMMWNILIAALLTGSASVLYDGSPVYPDVNALWKIAADGRATSFGASPTFVQIMEQNGSNPGAKFDLSRLESVLVSGAPSTPETFAWFYRCVKPDLWVTSQSGGTELCSALVGAVPTLPVYAGEIQARILGMDVHSWRDDGEPAAVDEIGELVVTTPFPSMPICFWNDNDGQRYQDAYFGTFPGVWRHGDLIKINARGGCYIYGRSDSTLNRHGVRIGTAEIYRIVERLPEVADSLVVCYERADQQSFMPLFVRLESGFFLDDELRVKINAILRDDGSPRHIPDDIYAVNEIPYTLTGKKMEVPVRKILMGLPAAEVASRDVMMNPTAIDWFASFANESVTG